MNNRPPPPRYSQGQRPSLTPQQREQLRRLRRSAAGQVTALAAAPPIPLQFPNLMLWLTADFGTFQDQGMTVPATQPGQTVAAWQGHLGTVQAAGSAGLSIPPTLTVGSRANRLMVYFNSALTQFLRYPTSALSLFQNITGCSCFCVEQALDTYPANGRVFSWSLNLATSGRVALSNNRPGASRSLGGVCHRSEADAASFVDGPPGTMPSGLCSFWGCTFDFLAGLMSLYQDGSLIAQAPIAGTPGPTDNTPSQRADLGGIGSSNNMNGYLGELLIYLSVLSPAQVASLTSYYRSLWLTP